MKGSQSPNLCITRPAPKGQPHTVRASPKERRISPRAESVPACYQKQCFPRWRKRTRQSSPDLTTRASPPHSARRAGAKDLSVCGQYPARWSLVTGKHDFYTTTVRLSPGWTWPGSEVETEVRMRAEPGSEPSRRKATQVAVCPGKDGAWWSHPW